MSLSLDSCSFLAPLSLPVSSLGWSVAHMSGEVRDPAFAFAMGFTRLSTCGPVSHFPMKEILVSLDDDPNQSSEFTFVHPSWSHSGLSSLARTFATTEHEPSFCLTFPKISTCHSISNYFPSILVPQNVLIFVPRSTENRFTNTHSYSIGLNSSPCLWQTSLTPHSLFNPRRRHLN